MLTPEQVEQRFQRIEGVLDRMAAEREQDRKEWREGMKDLRDAHIELEGAQLNQEKGLASLRGVVEKLAETVSENTANIKMLIDLAMRKEGL